jgi:hypothetical protein
MASAMVSWWGISELQNQKREQGKQTGSQEELLNVRVAMSSPVVMALTEPVTAMALTFLPYLLALFSNSTPLPFIISERPAST